MRLSGITSESIVDGPGLRYVIFTQGCPHGCIECQNPDSWDVNAGEEFTVKQIIRLIKKLKKTIQGITFSGGEPFLQAAELTLVADAARNIGLDVVTYTGYTYEQIIADNNSGKTALLYASDILIDGRYMYKLKTAGLPFRGSSNQRMIDIKETMKQNRIVLVACNN